METKIKVELSDLQKTLFMPVWARAIETQKEKPLIIDETASIIIETVDYDFKTMSQNVPEISQISWIARCKRFDRVIQEYVNKNPDATVVNIGCGLDTTYERINNPSVLWFDLDLPEVIALRKKFLPETEKRKFIAGSFLDTEWFENIWKKKVLFISTGVFVYFEEDEIRSFLIKVASSFPGSELLFDVTSLKGMKVANDVILKSGLDSNSFFKWGLRNKSTIVKWDSRLKLINTFYTFKIDGLDLSFRNKMTGLISDFLGIQYMLHMLIEE